MKKKTTKGGTPKTEKRFIVAWELGENTIYKAFPNVARAKGYAKELRDAAQGYIADCAVEDGRVQQQLDTLRLYAATLEPVEMEAEA